MGHVYLCWEARNTVWSYVAIVVEYFYSFEVWSWRTHTSKLCCLTLTLTRELLEAGLCHCVDVCFIRSCTSNSTLRSQCMLWLKVKGKCRVIRELHWLPVQRHVDFKLACFIYSSLSGQAPPYLADDIHLVLEGPRRRLCLSIDRSCAVPRMHNTFGDRSFAASGPRFWNSLPVHLRDEDISYNSFLCELKTFWF